MAEVSIIKTSLTDKVTRHSVELLPPARPTPHERKELSDVDSAKDLRYKITYIQFFKNNNDTQHSQGLVHPAKAIKEATAKALVAYYPLAGRLRAEIGKRLAVECTGEGIMFIEADADVTLEEYGKPICPPFCMKELLYDVPGTSGLIDCPLVIIQVTRLKCGGFIFAIQCSHMVTDGEGMSLFINAIAELARGAESPSVKPLWERHLLRAPTPTQVTSFNVITENDRIELNGYKTKETIIPSDDMVCKSFFFGPNEISALRSSIPPAMGFKTNFELISGHLWRSRTIALMKDPNEVVQFRFAFNIRSRLNPPLPKGYYGNALIAPVAETTAGKLSESPLHYAVELLASTKNKVNDGYIKALFMRFASQGVHDNFIDKNGFTVTDQTRLGLNKADFGWGEPVYGGNVHGGYNAVGKFVSPIANFSQFDENGVVVPVYLPRSAMDKFVKIFSIA